MTGNPSYIGNLIVNDGVHNFAVTVTLYSECILNSITTKLVYKKLPYLCAVLQCNELRNEDLNQN